MKSRTLYLINLLLLFSFKIFSSEYTIEKRLNWSDSLNQFPKLKDAIYFKSTGNIPFISDIIELPFYPNLNFSINNISQSALKSFDLTNVNTILKTNNVHFDFIVEKSGSKYILKYWFPAIQKNENGILQRINSISYTISIEQNNRLKSSNTTVSQNDNSKLSNGKWYKFEVIKNGMYKISNNDLSKLGISVSKSIRIFTFPKHANDGFNKAQMFDDLYEIPISYNDGGDGVFNNNDFAMFYGESPDDWIYDSKNVFFDHKNNPYSISNYYFVLVDGGNPLKIQTVSNNGIPDYSTTTFDNYDYHDYDETNVLKSGKQWFEPIPVTGIKYSLNNNDGSDIKFKVRTISLSPKVISFSITNDGTQIQSISMPGGGADGLWISKNNYFSKSFTTNSLKIGIENTSSSELSSSMLDNIIINYRSKLLFNNKQFSFRDSKSINSQTKYVIESSNDFQVLNVTHPTQPTQIQLSDEIAAKSFVYQSDTIENFVVFNSNTCYIPTFIENVENQDLHNTKDVDMIIIAADAFLSQANELKDLHLKQDGLQTIVVNQKKIFNEFSGGRICPEAIRDFVRYVYNKSETRLSYLLLLGDGSYKNKNLNTNNAIVTFQSEQSLLEIGSMVTDDFYALLDEGEGVNNFDQINGALDVAVGRIPVSNTDDANAVVKKTVDYCTNEKSRGDWRNRLLFLADDADGGETIHMEQANQLADKCILINPNVVTNKIFLDAYPQESIAGGQRYPTVNKAIESSIKNGCLLFNYTGHGNPLRMASEIVVDKSEIDKWQNPYFLPLFIAAACQVGRFDDETRQSLGENIVLSNHGGGIGIIASSRSVFSSDNMELNTNVFDYIFKLTPEGKPQYIGDILKKAKNKYASDVINKFNFVLLGDPAVRLNLPTYNIITDKENGVSVNAKIDTMKALSNITIGGHIENLQGTLEKTYNGLIQVVVLDKPQNVTTLSNDGAPAVTYKAQNNILFKGKASVINGNFSFSFIVPKDIFYYFGNGRISYYADNGSNDGSGSFQNFIVGGSSNNKLISNGGPKIHLYMNDTNFAFGGITNTSPTLLIKTFDNYGINVSGTAVGHDATAIVDANKSEQVVLNQFYESASNTYQKGSFRYPFSSLSSGKHTVDVKIWNINNEATESNLEFTVEESANIALSHVLNYPNPFTTNTSFYFEHNQSNQMLDVLIQIFTVSGKLIKTISTSYFAEGNRSFPISWDGRDDFGDPIGRGVYIYKVKVRNDKQQIAQKYEKLVILK